MGGVEAGGRAVADEAGFAFGFGDAEVEDGDAVLAFSLVGAAVAGAEHEGVSCFVFAQIHHDVADGVGALAGVVGAGPEEEVAGFELGEDGVG